MINEILLMASLIAFYGAVIALYRFFGKEGMFVWMAMATILANIEVLRLVEAFGIEQTLGNVLFGSTFLAVQILNENEGRSEARKCVCLGIVASLAFAVISQTWLLYSPAPDDITGEAFRTIFSMAPRVIGASVVVYAICQFLNVWIFNRIRKITTKMCGDERRFLWLRNNGSTIICQVVNTVLYSFGAFYGTYSLSTVVSICISSFAIFIVTSLCDTPAIYISRKIKEGRRSPY